ncbi:MAG TPA: glycosyltransferase family 4 protein, partial [Ferruginibacter sp.]|nr:glycosyltransferase family 4 protein [Ferruginibacter sp.]
MNSEHDTLVILTPGFPESEADTTCLPMQQQLVRNIKETYPNLEIIVLSFQYPYFIKTYKWFDTTVMSFDGRNKGGIARLLRRRKLMGALNVINQKTKIKGILSFWYGECAWIGKQFADKNNIKHYCWILGQDAKKGNKYIKYAKLKGNQLIALSDFLQDEFEKNYGTTPEFVIPPGIDAKQFAHPIKEKDIDIIAAGSLIPLKQYEIFIEVIAEIKEQVPGIKAMLIGEGPQKNKLQTLIAAHGLESNIILAGELPHPEVLQCMQRGKVFLHPSSYEGFGVVCIEALYAGCQV